MRIALFLSLVYCVAVLETSLGDLWQVGRVGPDLMALLAALWVTGARGPRRFLAAGVAGLASDLITAGPPGPAMALFLAAGYGWQRFGARWIGAHLVGQVAAVLVFTAVVDGVLAAGWAMAEPALSAATLLRRAMGVAVYTAGVSVPVLMVLSWTGRSSASCQLNPEC